MLHDDGRQGSCGIRPKHAKVPGGDDPRAIGQRHEFHAAAGRSPHEPCGNAEVDVLKIQTLQVRRDRVEPHGPGNFRHVPIRHRLELQAEQFSLLTLARPESKAVCVHEVVGKQHIGVRSPEHDTLVREPHESLGQQRVGGTGLVGRSGRHLQIVPVLPLHPAAPGIQPTSDREHLIAVESTLPGPCRCRESLPRLLPHPGDGQTLFGPHAAPAVGLRFYPRQADRLDPGCQLDCHRVRGSHAEVVGERRGVANTLGPDAVLARCGYPQLEQSAPGARKYPIERSACPVFQAHHRASNPASASGVDEPAADLLTIGGTRNRGNEPQHGQPRKHCGLSGHGQFHPVGRVGRARVSIAKVLTVDRAGWDGNPDAAIAGAALCSTVATSGHRIQIADVNTRAIRA